MNTGLPLWIEIPLAIFGVIAGALIVGSAFRLFR
jgi:hypothetical protein